MEGLQQGMAGGSVWVEERLRSSCSAGRRHPLAGRQLWRPLWRQHR